MHLRTVLNYDTIGIMPTVTISLPESLKEFLEEEVATRGYGNVSEYLRGLLREAQAKREDARLEALLAEGLASGEAVPVTKEFWAELKAEAAALAQKHNQRRRA